MTMTNATDHQLELGFNHGIQCRDVNGAQRGSRVARAGWWFTQMREVVANAMDWQTADPRPEQIWIPGATREIKV